MKRSTWLRLIAVILIISMLAVPVSAATVHNAHSNYGLIGNIIGLIRDIIRDIFDQDNLAVNRKQLIASAAGAVVAERLAAKYVITDIDDVLGA